MSTLAQFQDKFKALMLGQPEALDAPDPALVKTLRTGDIPLRDRLNVYRNNIVGGITDAVVATFPMIKALVGDDFLTGMARSFVLQHPPQQGCLNFYGRGFDDFIADFPPAKSLPYLPDVARLEIAMNDAYYATDDTALNAEALAAILPEDLGALLLEPRDSVQLVASDYPLMDIRALCNAPDSAEALDLSKGGVKMMIHRPALDFLFTPLDDAGFAMLERLQSGEPLGIAVEGVLAAHPEFDFQAFLQQHMELETFCSLSANSP